MTDKINDGGPAFPHPSNSFKGFGLGYGMSLRDYFIAHAPAEPQPWFEAVMKEAYPEASVEYPQRPENMTEKEREEWTAYRDEFLSEEDLTEPRIREYAAKSEAARKARNEVGKRQSAWNKEREKQRYIQWPAAWADAMLAAREVKHD